MQPLLFRKLTVEDCERLIDIDASQFIRNAWREVDGSRRLVEINYQDPSWPEGYERHYGKLSATVHGEGEAIGAFDASNRLVGFATVNRAFFGEQYKYVLLDQLFITLEHRSKGIGKKLFSLAADVARAWNADKIYICAGSSEETLAFYFAIGCTEALEINQALYENDPRDYQLEYSL